MEGLELRSQFTSDLKSCKPPVVKKQGTQLDAQKGPLYALIGSILCMHPELAKIHIGLVVHGNDGNWPHEQRFWLKLIAESNILSMLVTELTFQSFRGLLKFCARRNI